MAGTDSYTSRGGESNNLQQRRERDQKMWNDMLKMINSTKPETMLGYGLGKLLRGAWDHRQRRKAEKANTDGDTYQGGATSGPLTIEGIDPRYAEVDTARTYTLAPTKGLLGNELGGNKIVAGFMANTPANINPIALTAGQTKQTVEDSEGNKQTTTTETPVYTLRVPQQQERLNLPEMVARQLVEGNPFGMNDKKNYLGNISFPY